MRRAGWQDRDPYPEHHYLHDTFLLWAAALLFVACGLVWLIGQVAAICFGPQHEESAQLPPAGPLGAALPPTAAGPRGDQSHQQPVGQGREPEGEDGGGGHADRAG